MDWLLALQGSGFAQTLRASTWAYPIVATLHAVGASLAVGAVVLMDLRLLGFGSALDRAAVLRFALPVALTGAALALVAGLAMFSTGAAHYARNPAFLFKMGALVFALWNAVAFHRLAAASGRLNAVASLVAWLGVVAGGIFTAYY
ncbi:MAG: hypothetical protein O9320_19870 [Magnetospirillum sp.]|nr:hypothetical protein [Magnetospirillum sp.]